MYNKEYFEVGNDYKIIGNYCVHRYDKNDLFDDDDIIGIITKYDCNHTVAFIHENGIIEKYPLFDNGDRYYIFGSKMLSRFYKASTHDKRAYNLFDRIDDYNHDYIEETYILRYNTNDLLK
jgi:hypothetical protein